ncbi:MAG TPA: hypothetical protein VGK20_05030 [Candidatus Binatia bacterium]
MDTSILTKRLIETLVLVCAAVLEVGGDALIRAGLRGSGAVAVIAGFVVLGSYGIMVNQVPFDFSRMIGAYVGLFTLASVLFGRFFFGEAVPRSTWIGLVVILIGSIVIQYGRGNPTADSASPAAPTTTEGRDR